MIQILKYQRQINYVQSITDWEVGEFQGTGKQKIDQTESLELKNKTW